VLGHAQDVLGAVLPDQRREVGGRDAGHHAGQLVVEAGQQRGVVAAEREAVGADLRAALRADPAEPAAQVPHRLRLGVHHVEHVGTEEAVAREPADAPRAV
jgi:hypothetical protein